MGGGVKARGLKLDIPPALRSSSAMTTLAATQSSSFDLGRVIGETFAILGRRWWVIGGLYLVLGLIPLAILTAFGATNWRPGQHGRAFTLYCAATAVIVVLGWIRSAASVQAALDPPGQGQVLARALGAAARSFGVLLPLRLLEATQTVVRLWVGASLTGSLIQIGMTYSLLNAALWALDILFTLLWAVAVAVAVAERPSLADLFGRTWRLMARGRWQIVMVKILIQIVSTLPGWLFTALLFAPMLGLVSSHHAYALARAILLLPAAISGLIGSAWPAAIAASYRELCRVHDGAAPGEIAEVFG